MARDAKKLGRLLPRAHAQLEHGRADEGARTTRVASEATLAQRIAQLAANVAPAPRKRQRLLADRRGALSRAAPPVGRSRRRAAASPPQRWPNAPPTRPAKRSRDQSAIEKLIARDDAEAALKAIRALEAAPPTRERFGTIFAEPSEGQCTPLA